MRACPHLSALLVLLLCSCSDPGLHMRTISPTADWEGDGKGKISALGRRGISEIITREKETRLLFFTSGFNTHSK